MHQPTVGVLEKEQLHELVVKRSDLQVVRRVEVQERERLYLGVSVEDVSCTVSIPDREAASARSASSSTP